MTRMPPVELAVAAQEAIADHRAEVLTFLVDGVVVAPGKPTDPVTAFVEQEAVAIMAAESDRITTSVEVEGCHRGLNPFGAGASAGSDRYVRKQLTPVLGHPRSVFLPRLWNAGREGEQRR